MKLYDLEFPALALSMRPRLTVEPGAGIAVTIADIKVYARTSEETVIDLFASLVQQGLDPEVLTSIIRRGEGK